MTYAERASQSGKTKTAKQLAMRPHQDGDGRLDGSEDVKLVFFGNERLATGVNTSAPVLQALMDAGYDIKAVVSSYTETPSRSTRKLEIATLAEKNRLPLLLPSSVGDIESDLANLGAKAAILVAYGQIIPRSVIDIFPKGIINLHPSLLPKFRGPTPIEEIIIRGLQVTGVSLMRLSAKMDAGPIYARQVIHISGKETKQQLADLLLKSGRQLLISNLPKILNGRLKAKPQQEAEATYTALITKQSGQVDWHKPAEQLEREVRAYAGWPKSTAKIFGRDVIITKARVASSQSDGDLVIKCQRGWLEIQELKAPSGRTVSGVDFLHGYKKQI